MYALKEKTVGLLIYGGCGTALVCGFGSWFLLVGLGVSGLRFGSSDPKMNRLLYLGLFITVVALIVGIVGIVSGILASRNEHSGERRWVKNAKIVARYAIDSIGTMYTEDFSVEHLDKARFFVRMDIGDGDNTEYQCREEVYWQAGEGMVGDAQIQGKWLGAFRPYIGPQQGIQDDRIPRL